MPSSGRTSWIRRSLRIAAFVIVPLAALAAWLWMQPGDQFAVPFEEPGYRSYLSSLVYDEFDLAAMSLRGLNAVRGRQAGLLDQPFDYKDECFQEKLLTSPPLNDRYFLEYPHAALLLFRAGWWFQPELQQMPISGGVLDCDYHNLVLHQPETPEEQKLWRGFVLASRFYVFVMVLCLFALIAVLEWGYGAGTNLQGGALMLLLPASLLFTLNRYDVIPALFTAISFACLGRGWHRSSAMALGLGVLFKVYPILFAPFILRYLWCDRRAALRWFTALTATGALAFLPMLFGADLEAVMGPYRFQLTRPPEIGLTIYGFLLPEAAAGGIIGTAFRLGVLGLATALLLIQPITSIASILRRSAVALVIFVSLAVFYSPQWVLWFAPLLLPLVGRSRRLGWTVATLDVVTYLTFPVWFWLAAPVGYWLLKENGHWNLYLYWIVGGSLRAARFVVCAVLVWQLLQLEFPKLLIRAWLAKYVAPTLAGVFTRKPV